MNDPHQGDLVRKKDFQLSVPNETPISQSSERKESPTNLLPSIKSFNIGKSNYQHYGHKSSLHQLALDAIIAQDNDVTKPASDKTDLAPPQEDRTFIDESVSKILGLPYDKNSRGVVWPYNNETLAELLRFKTEQERTKQEEMKNEFASTALQLLTLVRQMNINYDLIPHLFNSSLSELQSKVDNLKSNPGELIGMVSPRKRSYSDTAKPTESTLVSPERLPGRTPPSVHRRGKSDESENAPVSNVHSPSSSGNPYNETFSQQHSPNPVSQAPPVGVYPVYYPIPPPPASGASSNSDSKGLGSPYQQKYHVVYHPGPPPPNGSSQAQQPYIPPQYHYYLGSPPNPTTGQGQYTPAMAPPPQTMVPETREADNHSPIYKRAKTVAAGKSLGNINFMISTPKNPPARKYNKDK